MTKKTANRLPKRQKDVAAIDEGTQHKKSLKGTRHCKIVNKKKNYRYLKVNLACFDTPWQEKKKLQQNGQ